MSLPRALRLLSCLALAACGGDHGDDHHHHDHDDDRHAAHEGEGAARGAHGGRLLAHGRHAVELLIDGQGGQAALRAWLYRDGEPLPPQEGDLQVSLARLDGEVERHAFGASDDHLLGDRPVREPHSFDVVVSARIGGESLAWTFEHHEGRTRLSAERARAAGIEVEPAGPARIRDVREVAGLLRPVASRHARIAARFPGPVTAVLVDEGDVVAAGQVLARVESNASLSGYAVSSPIAGTVLVRDAAPGELAGERPLFEVADLSRLWAELDLTGADVREVAPGMAVELEALAGGPRASGRIERIGPTTLVASQGARARVVVDNTGGQWRAGGAVRAWIEVAVHEAAVAVPPAALQRDGGRDVVYVRAGDVYERRPVVAGRRDAGRVEVLSGLRAGEPVVVAQSYLVKADIGKAGADHGH